jgi:hypothetical protein
VPKAVAMLILVEVVGRRCGFSGEPSSLNFGNTLRGSFEEYFEFSGRSRAVVVALCLWCGSGGYRNFNGTWI